MSSPAEVNRMLCSRLDVETATPLGSPVDPLVNCKNATSLAATTRAPASASASASG